MKYGVPTQKKIYTLGMSGQKPVIPTLFTSLEEKARSKMSKEAWAYVAGGAGSEATIRANRTSFESYKLKAGMMQSSSEIDLGVSLLGRRYESPLFAAPIGVLELAHKHGDLEVARACRTLNIPMIFSNQASDSMETCSKELGECPRWFQLYWSKSDELVRSFVRRAEECNCEAIVVTLDTTSLGWRPQDLDLGYLPFLRGMGLAQYSSDPVFQSIVAENMKNKDPVENRPPLNLSTLRNIFSLCKRYPGALFDNFRSGRALVAVKMFINIYMRPELRWEDLDRLRKMTTLPILVKGIQKAEDARMAFKHGVDGIIVSNHGGRQIDGGAGALNCLEDISNEDSSGKTILFDSGIRSGADVIKALALGADAVLIGRPYVYGLAIDGKAGVESVFRNLLSEIELQLSLMGIQRLSDLNRSLIY